MASAETTSALLTKCLHESLLDLHQSPYPHVANPPECKRRAAVALILRVRPNYHHWPQTPHAPAAAPDQSTSVSQQLDDFFAQDWVKHGDPEVLFIKRASRVGDRWTGHVALPGGKRDPEDADDRATATREAWEEIGLDLNTENVIPVGNLPERVVTTSFGKTPLMVLCPFIFLLTTSNSPPLKLQPTEVASTHWVSLRALLTPSLRTVELVHVSNRFAKQGGYISQLATRWMTGKMEFSALKLLPTESLYCSSEPGFLPDPNPQHSLFGKLGILPPRAASSEKSRVLLLWGLTLGVLADFLEMLPPHNAVELWKHPTFTAPDLRLLVSILTYSIRKRNAQNVKNVRRPSETATDDTTIALHLEENAAGNSDRDRDATGGHQHAIGIMLHGYYDRLRVAIAVFAAWRLLAGSVGSYYLFKWATRKPLARAHDAILDDVLFSRTNATTLYSGTGSRHDVGYVPGIEGGGSDGDRKPLDERLIKLGRTLRKLSPLLPTILINPLPTELLSPQITLHLFPSTHPHLPNVKGRVLYRAALWTVPVAWSSLPLLGNVRLQVTSERMVRANSVLGCEHAADCGDERLVVRWKTEPRGEGTNHVNRSTTTAAASSAQQSTTTQQQPQSLSRPSGDDLSTSSRSKAGVNKSLSTLLGGDAPIFSLGKEGQFDGLFIFAFDEQGRIAGHTIEHADQANGWDRTSKFVTLTDWLLGKAWGSMEPSTPSLAAQACREFNSDCDRRQTLHKNSDRHRKPIS
ncbi:putative protein C14C4,10c [Talaromyces islandicus]|uniref:Nudix hydrolase domain-containing protein n=1 Tax=Talaromyces islandicus TaxID=28573 RepID=A0A0U1LLK7_TALIS|nr:putative protein C14C4,10c [Talaromyces islandicus]